MDRNQSNKWYNLQKWPCEPPEKKRVFPEGSVRVNNGGGKCKHWLYFLLEVVILSPSEVMIGKKLLVDGKRTACLKQICLVGVIWKVLNRKTLSGETFCFLEKCLLSIFKFDALSNFLFVCFFFSTSWLVHNQLSWNVLLFSCDPIGQPCLSDPGYSSRTVILESLSNNDGNCYEDGKKAIILYWQNNIFACASRFLYFLCGRSMTTTWKWRELKATTLFFFSWTLIQSFRIQLQTNFLTFDKLNELE